MFSEILIEIGDLLSLALPSVLCGFFDSSMWVTDIIMFGHLGKGHLAAGSLGIGFFMIAWIFVEGALTSFETFAGYSTGSKEAFEVRLLAYVSLCGLAVVCVVATLFLVSSPWIIGYALPENSHVMVKSCIHVIMLIPTLWLMALHRVMSKYLQVQEEMGPVIISLIASNAFNIVGNYLLMYLSGLGFIGCSIATLMARAAGVLCLLHLMRRHETYSDIRCELIAIGTTVPRVHSIISSIFSKFTRGSELSDSTNPLADGSKKKSKNKETKGKRMKEKNPSGIEMASLSSTHVDQTGDIEDASRDTDQLLHGAGSSAGADDKKRIAFLAAPWTFIRPRLMKMALIGAPGGLMTGLDGWVLQVSALCIASMGTVPLDAHQILVTFTNFGYWAFTFGLSVSVSFRVSSLLGAGNVRGTKIVVGVSVLLGLVSVGIASTVVYLMSAVLAATFTNDLDVRFRVEKLATAVACFQVAFGIHGCLQGVLRGIGYQYLLAKLSFLSMWVVGLPTGLYLYYIARPSFGLNGVWLGLITGAGLEALVLMGILAAVDWDKEMQLAHVRRNNGRRLGRGQAPVASMPLGGPRLEAGRTAMPPGLTEADQVAELETALMHPSRGRTSALS